MTAMTQPEPNPPILHHQDEILLRQDVNGVATLTMNRPRALNALSVALLDAMQRELDAIAVDGSVKVVVIASEGSAFCSGHDLKEIRANHDEESHRSLFNQCSRMMMSINRLPQPVIAKVNGMATAAGCQLVGTCDLAIASTSARFATPGVNIGLFCSTPMVALSRAVGRKAALEMLFTGRPIDSEHALRIGLINKVVEPGELDGAVNELAGIIAAKSPRAMATGKDAFYRQIDLDLEAAYKLASETMTCNMLANDAPEGIDAFLEKREPEWESR